ncbi:MAG: LysM peptidoglycan-binding domain-containing protein [bacterium]
MKDLIIPVFLAVFLIVGGGCSPKVGVSDEVEREHPDMKKARELEAVGDVKGARNLYELILDRQPTMARAHLDFAFLLDNAGVDSVGTIYHFQRYLALRPETEKKAMIEGHIRTATLMLVGTVFTNETAVLARMREVEGENQSLKIRAANLQAQTVQLRGALATMRSKYGMSATNALPSVDAIVLPVRAPKSTGKMVRIEKADTLKKLAARYYGDQGRWREIYEVNKNKMKSPGDLRVGQMIFVPEKDNEETP